MSNVSPLFKCGRCGGPSKPFDLTLNGEPHSSGFGCGACIDQTIDDLARVRPVFDAMLTVGVDRVLANDTMTFLLERLHP